ncbi:MAG: glutamate synthase subunit beta [Deltaproteobacteria bacterium]|nr:glutamate synthase subunit beta [Deltaproteobacteria bacterium]MBI3388313.1 glutamate synthase subunit beta [Deltaproteobacteria bacterium]
MGKITGFLEIERELPARRPVPERLHDWRELEGKLPEDKLQAQGARCMDCGIPFCHKGCPLGNIIPDWNDLVYRGRWKTAIDRLHSTNNFPEFTGRVCPAPCEEACVLNINNDPVTIKQIEKQIIDHAWKENWIVPQVPPHRTGKTVAVVGSGPAGLACAQQLARAGHLVTLFERADRIGGLLRYGIPDFKMEKHLIDRRMQQMAAEGVTFRPSTNVGVDYPVERLRKEFDAIALCGGATHPRDLPVPGRELKGIHFAMEFLPQQNKVVAGDTIAKQIMATGKRVIILGGGDTGSDCLGTSNRQGATSVHQFELLPQPPETRTNGVAPWPYWPMILRTSSSHEEGVVRDFSINTKYFSGDEHGNVKQLHGVRLEWVKDDSGRMTMKEIPGSEFAIDCELVLLALGFLGPEKPGLLSDLGVTLDERGNVKVDKTYMSSVPGVFASGDMRRGQSLVVWAIWEGRECARGVDAYLMGATDLPASPDPF